MDSAIKKPSGISLVAIIAVSVWILSQQLPMIGSPVLGILSGMLLVFWKRPTTFQSGITYTSKKPLQYSIILLGFDMNLFQTFKAGSRTLLLMASTLTAAFLGAYLISKALKVDRGMNILIDVDTVICGGSVIAIAAPIIDAEGEDTAYSISTISSFNVIAALLFLSLGHTMQMSDFHLGLWASTAINGTSSAVAVSYTFSNAAGNLTIIVKLTRTSVITPIILVLVSYTVKWQSRADNASYSLAKVFLWFALDLVATAIISTFIPPPVGAGKTLTTFGKFMIVMAVAATGLNTNLVDLAKHSWRSIVFDLSCWAILTAASLAMQCGLLNYLLQ